MTNSIAEIADADFILTTGTNTTEGHPVIGIQVKKALRNGATLAVIDPRRTEIAELAHYHLQIKSGTDIALLNGLANVIINEGLWNKEFVQERTEDFEAFKEVVAKYTPEYVEEITGVPADTIKEVARGYAKAKKASILYTMGLTQHVCGTHNVFAVANLTMLCGHIGKESSGVNPLRGQNNVQGACDMGALPAFYTAYQPVANEANRAKFAAAWGVEELPSKPGLTVGEIFDQAGKTIKAIYIMGENPVLSDPDVNHVIHALESLDFLVVQDIFLTETAQLADVVLPAASFAEKDGTFSNTERRVQLVRKAIEPIGQAKPDCEIICLIATAMGYPMRYNSPAEIFDEMAKLTPSYAGISHKRLEQEGGLQWPCPTPDHPGTKFLHAGKFARGLGKFHAVEHIPPAEMPDEEYPFVLSTGRRRYHYHTGTMTHRTGALEVFYPTEFLEISCEDAEKLGICDGDILRVSSRRGTVEVAAKITDRVVPGLVFTSFQYPDVPINKLTNPVRCPIAKIPEYKVCAVKIEKVS